jgi:hypothetical protein
MLNLRSVFWIFPLFFVLSCGSTFDRGALQGEWRGIAFEGEHPVVVSADSVRLRFVGELFDMTGTITDVSGRFYLSGNTLYLVNEHEVEWPMAVESLEGDTLILNFNRMGRPALLKLARVR